MNLLRYSSIILISLIFSSCALTDRAKTDADITVAEVNGDPITLKELKENFNRSSSPATADEDDMKLEEFLDLYVNYRLKLVAAREAGYFENEEILNDLKGYESQSAVPYWLEKRVRDELLEELYERSKIEIHAKHILIQLQDNASPSDTAAVYNQLMEAREKYLNGEDTFDNLANKYSSRQQGRSVGGDLGYFSAGWAVKEFEDAVYATEIGEVSKPVRSQFGYHVILVKDIRENRPDRSFSHIYFGNRGAEEALEKATNVYERLQDGDEWDEMARMYSEDNQSRRTGGQIGWISQNRFDEDFLDNIYALENQGDYSEPFESTYGVHIIKLDSIRTFTSKEQELEHLYSRLRQLPRYRENEAAVLSAVKRAGNARQHHETRHELEAFLEANKEMSFREQPWEEIGELATQPLYSINGVDYTVREFINWMNDRLEHSPQRRYTAQYLDDFHEYAARDQLIPITRNEFDEFARLSQDYLNGLVVFSITEDSVWNYTGADDSTLRTLFEENPENFQFGQRYRYVRLSAGRDSLIHEAKSLITNGVLPDSLHNHIDGLIVRRDVINTVDTYPFIKMQDLDQGEFSEIFEYRRRQTSFYLEEILEPRQMTFEEAQNKLITTYQPIREKQWLEGLRAKYSVHSWPERITEYQQKN